MKKSNWRTSREFLREINRSLQTLLRHTGDLVFVTALYVVVDAANGNMTLANAGHPAPLQVCRETRTVVSLSASDGPGPALGLLPDMIYEAWEARLAPGDALLLFTDGLFEAADADGEEFGQTRLRSSVENQLIQSTPSLIDGLLVDIHAFRSTAAGFDDDVCIVAADLSRAI